MPKSSGSKKRLISPEILIFDVDGVLVDVRTEIVSFGVGGQGIEHGIEAALSGRADAGTPYYEDVDD